MITFKRVSSLSFEEAAQLFNEGFKHYFTEITLTVDALVKKIANEGLSPEHSVVAYDQSTPIGFVLNGFRTINGQKVSWNGGTGIIPEYRGKGVGKELIKACYDIYKEEGVDLCLLEAISENKRAIKLYENMGYSVFEELTILVNNQALPNGAFSCDNKYEWQHAIPQDVQCLSFHNPMTAWQTQAPSVKDGEAVIVKENGETVGYAVYKRAVNHEGKVEAITLLQCEAKPGYEKAKDAIYFMLHTVFGPADLVCRRSTMNFSKNNQPVYEALLKAGFTTMIEQVHMSANMSQMAGSGHSEKETANL